MDPQQIQDDNLIERYVAGKLTEREVAEFEAFLLDHPEHLDAVHWAEDLQASLRSVAAEETSGAAASSRATPSVWAGDSLQRWVLPIAAAVVLAVTPGVLFWQGRVQEDMNAQIAQPQINTPVISLGIQRGDQIPRIRLGPPHQTMVLRLELPVSRQASYRASLFDSDDRLLWQGEGLQPSLADTLRLSFRSSFLKAGRYRIRIEGLDADPGAPIDFPFEALDVSR